MNSPATETPHSGVIANCLPTDLRPELAKLAGCSARNLKYMRAFGEARPEREIVHQLGAQFPWKHNCVLLDWPQP